MFTYWRVYALKHQQRSPSDPGICVCRVYWGPTESTEPDRLSCCPLILTLPVPSFELDIKQTKWTCMPSQWASIWKHKTLMRGLSAASRTLWRRGERSGKHEKVDLPQAATQIGRFIGKALHTSIRTHFITKEMCQNASCGPSCFFNNRRLLQGTNFWFITWTNTLMWSFGNSITFTITQTKYIFDL